MDIYRKDSMATLVKDNAYVGRGIVIGKTADAKKAVVAYFIMGRSENSRNRVFVAEGDGVKTRAFDESKMQDPSLVIYNAVRVFDGTTIVTNGDQTDTIYNFLEAGNAWEDALRSRSFEPDAPNFTPRISALLQFSGDAFTYKMSILKSADEKGSACNRYTFSYSPLNGIGHFIHTYNCDGDPIPTFTGEPERVKIPDDIEVFTQNLWKNLDENNKISLYVRYTDIATGKQESVLINKNK